MDIFEKTSVETDQSETNSQTSINYDFSQGNLDDIPHPDDTTFVKTHKEMPVTKLLYLDDSELPPLPPDVCKIENHNEPSNECKDEILSLYDPGDYVIPAHIPLPNDFGFKCTLPTPEKKLESSLSNDSSQMDKNSSNNDRYSPSKVDSDEDIHDLSTAKPKVLGKEQAKKRLLAFSLSKQPSAAIKKHNKIAPSLKNAKEKPPNPNKGSGVQDQFRATISEIEEEKRKMLQNMPNYLLLEMSGLAKSTHPIVTSSLKLLEKHKTEGNSSSTKESTKKETENLNKSNESATEHSKESTKKNRHRSKSPSRNYRRSHSRSRDRTSSRRNRGSSKTRRRRSKSKSPLKQSKEKKSKSDKKDGDLISKAQELHKDWQSFKISGFAGGSEIWSIISEFEENDKHKSKDFRRSPSPTTCKQDYKPIFNYLKRESKLMKAFQARSADSRTDTSALFLEKCIKHTKAKPTVIWSENPSVATSFYMPKQMLIDHCDSATIDILNFIIHSNGSMNMDDLEVEKPPKSRPWYSSNFLLPAAINLYDEFELGVSKDLEKSLSKMKSSESLSNVSEESKKVMFAQRTEGKESELRVENNNFDLIQSRERRISLVNESYLSDEEEKIKEMVVGDVKVQMNLDSNRVKVRSRWDSDYDDEQSEEEKKYHKKVTLMNKTKETEKNQVLENKMPLQDFCTSNDQGPSLDHLTIEDPEKHKPPGQNNSNDPAGNLASEYEEFLKMVSFDSNSAQQMENETIATEGLSRADKEKESMVEESPEKISKPKFEMTDWDKDSSDGEDKSPEGTNYRKGDSEKEKSSLLLTSEDKASLKKKKAKNVSVTKKKSESVPKKENQVKKGVKGKKKRQSSSSGSFSTSDSYDSESDSDSDSDESRFFKKKKKKRVGKIKKKYKKQSSTSDSDSDSDTDSDDSKLKKKRIKKRKKRKSDSTESDEEKENVLLKQLDFKKQLIMKKIEEIDSISERSVKKKAKESKQKKKEKVNSDDFDFVERRRKTIKKKKPDSKGDKRKKKKCSPKPVKNCKESKKKDFSSDSSEENHEAKGKMKKKSEKMEGRRKRNISESGDSDSDNGHKKSDKLPGIKSLKSIKKMKKTKKVKKNICSTSDSESEDSSSSEKKKPKKKEVKNKEIDENTSSSWKDSFSLNDTFKSDRLEFEQEDSGWKISTKKAGEKVKEKTIKDDDWEASSSSAESAPRSKGRESWDDEVPSKEVKVEVIKESSNKIEMSSMVEKNSFRKNIVNGADGGTLQSSNNMKSFSSVTFNENSLSGFGPELSRNFFLSMPNSDIITGSANLDGCSNESRIFQTVSKDNGETKPNKSELYSPGHSDSDASDVYASKSNSLRNRSSKEEKYDPLNSESDTSEESGEAEVNKIPLPCVSDISLQSKEKAKDLEFNLTLQNKYSKSPILQESIAEASPVVCFTLSHNAQGSPKTRFTSFELSPGAFNDTEKGSVMKQVISMKSQPKLKSKAASVFQDDSDDDASDSGEMAKEFGKQPEKGTDELVEKTKSNDSDERESVKVKENNKILRKREESLDRHNHRDQKRRRSSSRERKTRSNKTSRNKTSSPHSRRKSKTPEPAAKCVSKEKKREIRSDSFEIEPLKSAAEYEEVEKTIQPIPVLTGLSTLSSEQHTWTRSHFLGYTSSGASNSLSGDLVDPSESFDIYPSDDSKFRNRNFDKVSNDRFDDSTDKSSSDKSAPKDDKKKNDKRRSRSRSISPRKRRRSKSPERGRKSPRNRSPRRRSKSPKRRDLSPYSPRRKSPKRKSPSRWYRSSRSPDRRRKSRSRSPRKRRTSPSRRSHSLSPRKHRSPKRRDFPRRRTSPSRGYSPRKSMSPRRDIHYPHHYSNSYHNRIPVIGAPNENLDGDLNPSKMGFSRHEHPLSELDMNNSYYNREYTGEFGAINYSEEVGGNNLITVKNHDLEKPNSPERLSLDQRIELELGVPMGSQSQGDQFHKAPFQDINSGHYPNSLCCENSAPASDNFYANHNSDFNSQYYNGHPPPAQSGYGSFQQYSNSQNSMLQVGNIVEVVPTMQHSHPPSNGAPKNSSNQIMQVGNVLQVVPSQKNSQPFHGMQGYVGPPSESPVQPIKTQKATAVVAPSSIIPQPNPEALINPLIKAIQLEREKRKKEKEKRKAEREERRKARQLRREAKLMSVNEKLKKSVQDEGLMLGQEVEDDELMDALDLPSPPIPVEIITVTSPSALPPAGKGILITAGFMPKPPSEKKEVKFADGVLPGEGTSSSGDEDVATPPPKPKLPKEKRYKKKKMKVKKKVKVQIIRQIIEHEEDDEEDLMSPPPPPPGDPPPIYFARFPFLAGDAQFPVYHTQTTTTTTTVQYPAQSF